MASHLRIVDWRDIEAAEQKRKADALARYSVEQEEGRRQTRAIGWMVGVAAALILITGVLL